MRYGLLGPLALDDDGWQEVAGTRARALLAVLLAADGRAVLEHALVDALWPDDPPRTARHTLHTHVARLRTRVGDDLRTVDGGYALAPGLVRTDAADFDALVARAETEAPVDAVGTLRQALDLWRGPAFGRCADLPAVAPAAARLEGRRLDATERLAAALVAAGHPDDAVHVADELTTAHPHRETAWVLAVRARVAAGRAAEAVAVHASAVRHLDSWGLRPGPALAAAQQDALGEPTPHRDRGTTDRTRTSPGVPAPIPTGTLVGRADDLLRLEAALDAARLVTLTGPGGVGKTRLALELAAAAGARARFVELGALRDPAAVPDAVAAALGLAASAGPPARALRHAGAQPLLVVVDSCEHVLDAAAETVRDLLSAPGALRVVATSVAPLGVAGEHVHRVAPLRTEGEDPDARRLFVDRALAAGADPASLPVEAVDRVVHLLDGLPLAVEMAAARAAVTSPDDLAAELVPTVAGLQHPGRDADPRHRSLTAVVGWSRDLLPDAERAALDGWPVFAGATTPADAVAVLGVGAGVVEHLLTRSLLVRDDAHGRTRVRMLRVVRDTVGVPPEDSPVRARYAAHVLDVVEDAARRLRTGAEAEARTRVDDLLADVRAAHSWARTHDRDLAVALTRALHGYAVDGLRDEVLAWAADLASGGQEPPVTTSVAARSVLAGDHARGAALAAQARSAAAREDDERAALEVEADARLFMGELDACVRLGDELAARAAEVDHVHHLVVGRSYRALAAAYAGDRATAYAALATMRAAVADRSAPPPTAQGWCAFVSGEIEADADPDAAADALVSARRLAAAGGNRYLEGVALAALSSVTARHAVAGPASTVADEALQWWLDAGDRTHLVTTLRNLVPLVVRQGRHRQAARLWGACVAHPDVPAAFGTETARLDAVHAELLTVLGPDRLADLVAAGAADGPERAAVLLLSSAAG